MKKKRQRFDLKAHELPTLTLIQFNRYLFMYLLTLLGKKDGAETMIPRRSCKSIPKTIYMGNNFIWNALPLSTSDQEHPSHFAFPLTG